MALRGAWYYAFDGEIRSKNEVHDVQLPSRR